MKPYSECWMHQADTLYLEFSTIAASRNAFFSWKAKLNLTNSLKPLKKS